MQYNTVINKLKPCMTKNKKRIICTAELPEEALKEWRVFVVLVGGKILMPRRKDDDGTEEGKQAKEAEKPMDIC